MKLAELCQTVILRDGFYCLPLTPIIESFYCIPFISVDFFFKNKAVDSIADVRHIVMIIITLTFSDVITFSDVKLNGGVRDVLYNQCTSNT